MNRTVRGWGEEREEFLVDIGIIAGFVATSYVAMRAGPHVRPLAGALVQRVRLRPS
jgi:hypothetical protein